MEEYLIENNTMFNTTKEVPTKVEKPLDMLAVFLLIFWGFALFVLLIHFILFFISSGIPIILSFFANMRSKVKKCWLYIIRLGKNMLNKLNNRANEESPNSVHTRTPIRVITVPPNSLLDQPAATPLSKDIDLPSYEEAVANNEQPPPKYSDLF
ncbi:hypothetical protein NEIRO03_2217 [Nematocida sp. AWRm78]|nr:hypothetical protein NEIRO02_2171 [Nematocida sp. AWRm79]KAI5186124.1 hypothetical protein NEIRO03_2217 [Nematocida sp. AWRm78]